MFYSSSTLNASSRDSQDRCSPEFSLSKASLPKRVTLLPKKAALLPKRGATLLLTKKPATLPLPKKATLLPILLFAGMLIFNLCGCGNEGGKLSSSQNSDQSNTLVYAGENESTINPVLSSHDEIVELVFSGLMKYDKNGNPVEDLAESYSYDDTNNTYTFALKKEIKWHDGTSFSAKDVVFTYNALINDKTLSSSITSNYENITNVNAIDENTVSITLDSYCANMLGYFTVGIIPQHLLEGQDLNTTSFNQNPIGTGRFKFSEWDRGANTITFLRNEDYYGKVPNIERIIYKTVANESTKATMLESGEADLAWLNAKYAETFRTKTGFTNWDFTTADYRSVSMDMSSEFWKNNSDSIGVLNYAIDKDAIVKSVLNGQGCSAYSPIQKNTLGTNKQADIYSYDLNKFAEKMEELGWKKGDDGIYVRNNEKFHFTIQVRDYEEERIDIANIAASMLKQAGVEMEVSLVTKFDWKAGYDGFLAGFAAQFDPDMIYGQFVSNGSDNTTHYSNSKVDQLLMQARHSNNAQERLKLYGEFEEAYAQNPNAVLIAYLDGNYVSTNTLNGLDTSRVLGHHAVGIMYNIEEWTLNK